jgi:hypothetical protein
MDFKVLPLNLLGGITDEPCGERHFDESRSRKDDDPSHLMIFQEWERREIQVIFPGESILLEPVSEQRMLLHTLME